MHLLIGFDMVEMRPQLVRGWLEHADVISMSTRSNRHSDNTYR